MKRRRSDHTWITDYYKMNGTIREPPPIYPMCNNDVLDLDVPHILLKCPQVEQLRINNIKAPRKKEILLQLN